MEKALIRIFQQHEEELESYCPDYAVRVQELMQKDLIAGDRVGSRYSKQFSEDVTMRCGDVIKEAAEGAAEGDNTPVSSEKDKNEEKKKNEFSSAPKLSLEERIKLQLNEKMAEDREISQMVAQMEEQILNNSDEHEAHLQAEQTVLHEVEESPAKAHFIQMCDNCGERHLQEHRECDTCEEVHEGCCEL